MTLRRHGQSDRTPSAVAVCTGFRVPFAVPGDVHYCGLWLRGRLSVWRKDDADARLLGYVEFSHPNRVTQPRWFDQDEVRPRQPA